MAYMTTIVRVSQDYAGLAWFRYDAAFCCQAALIGNTRWSVINPTLYTMCFTGKAAAQKRCELCSPCPTRNGSVLRGGIPSQR